MGTSHREIYEAIVTSIDDPEQRGRIKVKSQALLAEDTEIPDWIEPCFPFTGGNDAGWFFLPDVDDPIEIEVLVGSSDDDVPGTGFLAHPDLRWRCCCYSDTDDVPSEVRADGKYGKRMGFKDRAGQVLIFDTEAKEMFLKFGKLRLGSEKSASPLTLGDVLKTLLSSFLGKVAAHKHVFKGTATGTCPNGGGDLSAGACTGTTDPPDNAAEFTALKGDPVDNGAINSDIAFTERKDPAPVPPGP